jgi:hypothetical protein
MKRYLLKLEIDVADEDNAVLLTVVDEDTLNQIKKSDVEVRMFQCENDTVSFDELNDGYNTVRITEIDDDEYEYLKKLDVYIESGTFIFYDENGDEIDVPNYI